jgi:hypothetical protein
MTPRKYILPAIFASLALLSFPARADVVVLKTGKKVVVEKVWREDGKIWIFYQGMKASIPQSKVERIESASKIDPEKSNPQKEAKLDVKNVTTSSPPSTSRQQTKHAAQSTSMPPPVEINKDQRLIFPDGVLSELRWGTKITESNGLVKVLEAVEQDGVAEYQQKKEKLTFGQAELSSINLAFWRDRLYMLTIGTEGRSNFTALRGEVFRQFGRGLRTDPALERYLWTKEPNDIMLQYSEDGQQGLLWLRSSELDRQYKLSQIKSPASLLKWMKSRN